MLEKMEGEDFQVPIKPPSDKKEPQRDPATPGASSRAHELRRDTYEDYLRLLPERLSAQRLAERVQVPYPLEIDSLELCGPNKPPLQIAFSRVAFSADHTQALVFATFARSSVDSGVYFVEKVAGRWQNADWHIHEGIDDYCGL